MGKLMKYLKSHFPPETSIISASGSPESYKVTLRLKCASKEEFCKWFQNYQDLSRTTFRVAATRPSLGIRVLYKAVYRCQHNTYPNSHRRHVSSSSPKHTGCRAKLHVTIKTAGKNTLRSKDKLRQDFPTIVSIDHCHNHAINAPEALKYRDVSEQVRLKFVDMFKSLHTPSRSLELHKQDLLKEYEDEYHKVLADRSLCPDVQWVYRLYYKTLKECGAFEDRFMDNLTSMLNNLSSDQRETKFKIINDDFVIASCPPLMRRAHKTTLAGQIVFLDSSRNIDRCKCRVFLLMTDSCVGGLPLAFFITSSEKEAIITEGLHLLRDVLPNWAFGERGLRGPDIFAIDDAVAEQNAFSSCFPESKLCLCTFHILQMVWTWLWDNTQDINMHHRNILYDLFRKIVYAPNSESFFSMIDQLMQDEVAKSYDNFITYVNSLLEQAPVWSHNFQDNTCGYSSINTVESAMRVMKDKMLNQTQAYNIEQLFHFVYNSLTDYYSEKITDLISGKYKPSVQKCNLPTPKNYQGLAASPFSLIEEQAEGIYVVKTALAETEYTVNVELGCCTCPVGKDGSFCKHQHAVVVEEMDAENIVPLSDNERIFYHWVATGCRILPDGWNAPQPTTHINITTETSISHTRTANVDAPSTSETNHTQVRTVDVSDSSSAESVNEDVLSVFSWNSEAEDYDECKQKLDFIFENLERRISQNPTEYLKAVNQMFENYTKMKTLTEITSALYNFGKIQFPSDGTVNNVTTFPAQETAILRKIKTRGQQRHHSRGPPNSECISEHGYAKLK